MLEFRCCFCGREIERPGVERVSIALAGPGTVQELSAHIACLDEKFAPALAAGTPFDAAVFEPD